MLGNHIAVRPLAGAVGAEIAGLDLSEPLSDASQRAVRQALASFGVVVFRDQVLTPDQHIARARQFGAINVNRFFAHAPGYPEIALVVKEPEQTKNIGGGWHTDHSYDEIPALGSMLYAREVPPAGGDTLFTSMYAAYDGLSDGLKQTLAGLRALHSSRHVFGVKRPGMEGRIGNADLATQDAVPPVAVCQPRVYAPVRWLDGRGIEAAAGFSLPPRGPAGVHLPVALAGGVAGVLGQPVHLALRAERLPGGAAADAPDHHRGVPAALTEAMMGQPAARLTDMHVCPMWDGPVPHVGGPVVAPGCPTVLIGGLPAARVTDMAVCCGPPDMIAQGSPTVLIGGLLAARMGDMTVHGGVIVVGDPTVLIGDGG